MPVVADYVYFNTGPCLSTGEMNAPLIMCIVFLNDFVNVCVFMHAEATILDLYGATSSDHSVKFWSPPPLLSFGIYVGYYLIC